MPLGTTIDIPQPAKTSRRAVPLARLPYEFRIKIILIIHFTHISTKRTLSLYMTRCPVRDKPQHEGAATVARTVGT